MRFSKESKLVLLFVLFKFIKLFSVPNNLKTGRKLQKGKILNDFILLFNIRFRINNYRLNTTNVSILKKIIMQCIF